MYPRFRRVRSFGLERLAMGRSLPRAQASAADGEEPVAGTDDPEKLGLSPVSAAFRPLWDGFYGGVFLPDGYPGRRQANRSVIAHPLYGTYLLADYLRQGAATGDTGFVRSAQRVAWAAVRRMDRLGDALVFWYEPEWRLSTMMCDRFYSALTQSKYAVALGRTGAEARDRGLVVAAQRAFNALLVPASAGGVMEEGDLGVSFAEVPTRPVSMVLNGWQSTLYNMWLYADMLDDQDIAEEVRALVRRSARTMARLLPLYDMPEIANSRYSLSGPQNFRLVFSRPGTAVSEVRLEIPRCGLYPVRMNGEEPTRWRMYARLNDMAEGRVAHRQLRMNLVLSRVSFPNPNMLHFIADSDREQSVKLQVLSGKYDPVASSPTTSWWRTVAQSPIPAGTAVASVPIPWDHVNLIGYPTTFTKLIDGRPTNVYHPMHVGLLRALAKYTEVAELDTWAQKWADYLARWPDIRRYRGLQAKRAFD